MLFSKGDDMKRMLLGMLAIMMLVMSGCGGGTVEVVVPIEPVINPPSITLNQFTQDRVRDFIDGSVVFFAPDADIDTMTVSVFDSIGGFERSRTTAVITLPGVVRGTIPFSIDYLNFPNGTFTFSIFLTDIDGFTSNLVVGTFSAP